MAEHTKQYVYFGISGREVKIGLAHDPPNRIADMRTARPNIKLFGCIPGSRETERHLHQCFSKDRISGEWFYFTPEVEAALRELLNNNNEAVPATDQIKNSCGEEFRHRQRELRIKHFKNLKLYPVMLRVGDKKKHFWRVTKPRIGGGRSVKTYSNRYETEAAFDLAYAQVANRDIESREKPAVARPLAPPQANDLPARRRPTDRLESRKNQRVPEEPSANQRRRSPARATSAES